MFPAPPGHLPDKDEVADYLERYAERFDLPVRPNTTVRSVRRSAERFEIDTTDGTFEADNVIVATGALQRPNIPLIAAKLDASMHQLHSSEYHARCGWRARTQAICHDEFSAEIFSIGFGPS